MSEKYDLIIIGGGPGTAYATAKYNFLELHIVMC
jgi:pyruvate/2-oxoglutarate dehydrogenase complex dihydrolipoamide dehydrogenase (E3) component